MKLKISELKANPFKKYINDGKLNNERLDILRESIEHGTLPEHFFARKNNGVFELTSGHHKLEALKQVKGNDYQIDVTLVSFTDEQMLIDLVRENITQRDTDYHDTGESILLSRSWIQSKATSVKQFNKGEWKKTRPKTDVGQFIKGETCPDSYRSIARFLSKNGKTMSYGTVKNYLDVFDKLHPELLKKVRKVQAGWDKNKGDVTVKQAMILSTIKDKQEQIELFHAMELEPDGRPHEFIPKYKEAPEEIKKQVRQGKLLLSEVEEATLDKNITGFNKENPRSEFIPNFASRLKQFDKDVYVLEKQVKAFSMVFHDNRFKERYATLKPKQKDSLHNLIFNIRGRVKKCYEEVEYFRDILGIPLDKNIIMLKEGKNK